MAYAFIIEPGIYTTFEDEAAQVDKCKEWGLLSGKASKAKTFYYKGNGMNLPCSIVGFVDHLTAVIEFDSGEKHCIHPSYLKEMQASSYAQKIPASSEEAAEQGGAAAEAETEAAQADKEAAETTLAQEADSVAEEERASEAASKADAEPSADSAAEQPITLAEEHAATEPAQAPAPKEPAKGKAKKLPKPELPEDKVKMIATVKEFATVPNHFSDNDDEVVIYEEVSIVEPETVIGDAWSSYSATLKKLELEVGDKLTFEAKVIAKKLTKHPVPYKINNPSKLQKEQPDT
ncbi:hypothetical protein SK3146_03433 [Paenibacillus konkukensis]|uniref:Uncharacterized protein n=1 Tax=Paenibacillus konkukensis TaxID=2020716 RepID=A0ABY4RQD3_9BACL|nr:hypothetical protein [Paenibacillus konkukensis]UQZ84200.1 hypothetical protein SK3146_03433 [Paenibacillus konkukensis]